MPLNDIFKDRRKKDSRRRQQLAMPNKLNRRDKTDRRKGFSSENWWLKVNYAVELNEPEKTADENSVGDKTINS